jgi:hypothetical protein
MFLTVKSFHRELEEGHIVSANMDAQIVLDTPEAVEMFLNALDESEHLDRHASAPHPYPFADDPEGLWRFLAKHEARKQLRSAESGTECEDRTDA